MEQTAKSSAGMDGGPVFPQIHETSGVSLRDWFAAKTLDTLIHLTQSRDGEWDPVAVAVGAYAVADAMILQREIV